MYAEASTILRAVAADFFFNCCYLEIPSDNRIRHIPSVYVTKEVSSLCQFRRAVYTLLNDTRVQAACLRKQMSEI
jgi:hypothetical protein